MPERNMVSWNVMHGGYWKGGKPECALKFRNVMHANVSGLCLFSTFELTIQLPWNVISDFWAVLYGLVHVAAGDLLGAEIASGSENGRRAREHMEQGKLVPDEIVVMVPEDILVERVVGRRLDPITGKIYHLKYSPPETQEIVSRLTQRFDNTEETVKL
ncbi:adenylate kinase 2, chloroplastic-like isoform X2 [Malus sylvestris]|nr:adenylate kinase 2, chloroplastic-like isoform X2 [Malus sylvestris]